MNDRPFASRLLIMVAAFAVFVPVARLVRSSDGQVVKAGGLPGAAVAADPLIAVTTPPSTTVAPVTATPAPATTVSAETVAIAEVPTPESAAPATAKRKTTATTAKKAPPTTAKAKTATTAKKPSTNTTVKTTPAPIAAPKPTSPPTTEGKAPPATAAKAPPATAAKAPASTAPATTTPAAPPANNYSKVEVENIIRSVWPADLADEAVRIAKRESGLVPTVRNWCCFGLFQIYFDVNKKSLASLGITSAEQLYDPLVNSQAAYFIYQRSGWAPWQ